jgi:hypothetical protein
MRELETAIRDAAEKRKNGAGANAPQGSVDQKDFVEAGNGFGEAAAAAAAVANSALSARSARLPSVAWVPGATTFRSSN